MAFLVQHPVFGPLCYFCDLTTSSSVAAEDGNDNGSGSDNMVLTVTPRDSYRRTVFVAALGLQIRSDAGTLAKLTVDLAAKTVTVFYDEVGTQPLSEFRFRVLCRSGEKLCPVR